MSVTLYQTFWPSTGCETNSENGAPLFELSFIQGDDNCHQKSFSFSKNDLGGDLDTPRKQYRSYRQISDGIDLDLYAYSDIGCTMGQELITAISVAAVESATRNKASDCIDNNNVLNGKASKSNGVGAIKQSVDATATTLYQTYWSTANCELGHNAVPLMELSFNLGDDTCFQKSFTLGRNGTNGNVLAPTTEYLSYRQVSYTHDVDLFAYSDTSCTTGELLITAIPIKAVEDAIGTKVSACDADNVLINGKTSPSNGVSAIKYHNNVAASTSFGIATVMLSVFVSLLF